MTELWMPQHDRTVVWNDPVIGVRWPLQGQPVVSAKDAAGALLSKAELYP
jgi:dTDP-4-dehydrorhamnose 3,5-epimerase